MKKIVLNDTKERILNVANKLFGIQGYHATSIREIAKEAEVNIAAINYHFKNKENLYSELFIFDYQSLSSGIDEIGMKEEYDSREFTWQVFQYFNKNQSMLLNTFKMFLTTNVEIPSEVFNDPNEEFGPPGKDAFIKVIRRDLGEDIPFDGLHWAMRMIFSDIVHFSISMSSPIMQAQCCNNKRFSEDERKRSVYFLVEAILDYLKRNPKNWE
jgi:AcrR family transcriptional regulator